jgi:hypothetical protein
MGGWVTAETLAHDDKVLGAVIISAGDMGFLGLAPRTQAVALMNDNREALAGVTGDSMADEVAAHAREWSFAALAPKLLHRRLLVLYSDDFVKGDSEALIAEIRSAGGGAELQVGHEPTDHSWSDHRIALETRVIEWLESLPPSP